MIPIREDLLISTKGTVQPQYLGHGDPALKDYYPAWVNNIADDATVGGSMLNGALQGADAVRSVVLTIRSLYEHQEFKFAGPCGDNGFLEDYVAKVSGDTSGVAGRVPSCPRAQGTSPTKRIGSRETKAEKSCASGLRRLPSAGLSDDTVWSAPDRKPMEVPGRQQRGHGHLHVAKHTSFELSGSAGNHPSDGIELGGASFGARDRCGRRL